MITHEQLARHLTITGHSLFGPSSLKQRKECPASAREEMTAGIQPTSKWAAAGTMLHDVMEQALYQYLDGGDGVVYIAEQPQLTEEQKGWCYDCYHFAMGLIDKHEDPTIYLEVDMTLGPFGVPEVTGTADLVITSRLRADVVDWKFGMGVPVYAKDNIQGASYAAGAIGFPIPYKMDIHIHIAQAPLDSFTEWVVTPDELSMLMTEDVYDIVQEARADGAEYGPSMSACRFCAIKMECNARAKYLTESQVEIIKAAEAPEKMVEDKYLQLLNAADAIGQAIKDVRAYAEKIIKAGGKFGDFKMVTGRSSRKPISNTAFEEFVAKELGDKAYTKKLVTVAGAEKIKPALKKDTYYQDLWQKVPGKPVLVKGTDKRKAIAYGSASHFQKYVK